ncbi:MAG: ankyrin repeat domain-containing protein [Planctomycetaceae bacterium]|nr:ankyrin repeat domain-containing protein [Planctomycetaceae bacterium]
MITFKCRCGKAYKVEDRLAGREAKCNKCMQTFIIPTPQSVVTPPVQRVSALPVNQTAPVSPKTFGPVTKKRKNSSKPIMIAGIAGVMGVLLLLLIVGGVWRVMSSSTVKIPLEPRGSNDSPPKPAEPVPVVEKSKYKDVFEAVRRGTVQDVRHFIEKEGVDINAREPDLVGSSRCTILHIAVIYTKFDPDVVSDIVKYLIENGADVNLEDKDHQIPLHSAIQHDSNLATIKYLVAKGSDVKAENIHGMTPLRWAIEAKMNLEIIKFLVSQEADINVKNKFGHTLLHTAINAVISAGNPSDNDRESDLEIARFLVSKGADINAKAVTGQTPLHFVIERGGYSEFPNTINFLLSQGADINAKDMNGQTILHIAVSRGRDIETIKYLVSKGADLTVKDRYELTPFDHAKTGRNYADVAEYLASLMSAKLRFRDVFEAAGQGTVQDMQEFIEKEGVNINARSATYGYNYTILHTAIHYNPNPDVAKYLIEKGADVNAIDSRNCSPLYITILRDKPDDVEIIKSLVSHGANVKFQGGNSGQSLLDFAREMNRPKVVEYLKSL